MEMIPCMIYNDKQHIKQMLVHTKGKVQENIAITLGKNESPDQCLKRIKKEISVREI